MSRIGLGVSIVVLILFISIPIIDWLIGIYKASKAKQSDDDDIINKLLK